MSHNPSNLALQANLWTVDRAFPSAYHNFHTFQWRWLLSLPHASTRHPARRNSRSPPHSYVEFFSESIIVRTRTFWDGGSHDDGQPPNAPSLHGTDPCVDSLLRARAESYSGQQGSIFSADHHAYRRRSHL